MTGVARPSAVILDLDGTLVDTVPNRIDAWMAAFAEHSVPAQPTQVAHLIGSDGRLLAREVAKAAGRNLSESEAEAIDARSGALFNSLNRSPQPLSGAREFLDALDDLQLPWAIATSSRRDQVAQSVAALARSTPPRIVDGTAVPRAKPHPDLLLAAAAELEHDPGACWCVGDSVWDMRAAVAASMVPIAVTEGSVVEDAVLRKAGASLVVKTMRELSQWLA